MCLIFEFLKYIIFSLKEILINLFKFRENLFKLNQFYYYEYLNFLLWLKKEKEIYDNYRFIFHNLF